MKLLADFFVPRASGIPAAHEFAAETRAHTAVGILNGLRLVLQCERSIEMNAVFQHGHVKPRLLLRGDAVRMRDGHHQQRIHARTRAETVIPAGEFTERANAELREAAANFFGKETEIRNNHFRLALKTRAKRFVLRGNADGASVQMALSGHNAADGEERGGAETEFVRAKNGGKDDIAREFQAPIHAERET